VSGNKDGLPRQSTASGAKRQKELARLKLERQVVRRHARSQRAKRREPLSLRDTFGLPHPESILGYLRTGFLRDAAGSAYRQIVLD
jgi:hypothetical protein